MTAEELGRSTQETMEEFQRAAAFAEECVRDFRDVALSTGVASRIQREEEWATSIEIVEGLEAELDTPSLMYPN